MLIEYVIVSVASVRNGHRTTRRIVSEAIYRTTLFLPQEQATIVVPITVSRASVTPPGTLSAGALGRYPGRSSTIVFFTQHAPHRQ